jgi:hypothetical protein
MVKSPIIVFVKNEVLSTRTIIQRVEPCLAGAKDVHSVPPTEEVVHIALFENVTGSYDPILVHLKQTFVVSNSPVEVRHNS